MYLIKRFGSHSGWATFSLEVIVLELKIVERRFEFKWWAQIDITIVLADVCCEYFRSCRKLTGSKHDNFIVIT